MLKYIQKNILNLILVQKNEFSFWKIRKARKAEKFRIKTENKKKFDEEVNDFKNQFENSRSTTQLETKINNLNAKNEKLLTENKNLENEINSIKKKLNSKRASNDKKVQLKNK